MTDGKSDADMKVALKNFVKYLADKKMLRHAENIIDEYRKIYNHNNSIVEATVTLISRMDEQTRLGLREALKKKHAAREVHMLEKVDQRILGGMKVQIGDMIYDNTVQSSLAQLQAQLAK